MRILIIKLGAIGDVLRTTSVLGSVPICHWLTYPSGKEVLLNNPLIDRVFVWEERGDLGDYDLVIGLEDDFNACELASKIKSKKILGAYVKDGKITYTPCAWFDMSAISRFGLDKANELKKENRKTFQEHMGDLLGIKVGPYIFDLTPEEIKYGKKVVVDLGVTVNDRIIGINTGAGKRWQLKALSIEKTIELINKLKKDLGVVSLILGGEEEKERNRIIAKETGMPNAGIHTLRNFAGVINQCQALVTSDSLAMHFGIALKKKIIAFFWANFAL
ncbi:MAG: glycosyltransferase family 9 protein [Candidatus Saganbacteria bacterium]|nr:glycosyltransferase family 9 protein [Candidatus Saganbacteria bacterium]